MGDGGGFQQLIIIGLFLLFGLADLVARWARGRTQPEQGRDPARRTVPDDSWRDADSSDVVVVVRRPERVEEEPVQRSPSERDAQRAPSAPARSAASRPGSDRLVRDRSARDRTSSVRQSVMRSAPVRPVASRLATGGMSARDRASSGVSGLRTPGLAFTAADARRGIIAMTVLGPCRAHDDADRVP